MNDIWPKIRTRERRGYVKEAQGYTAWTEYQVVIGRKVVFRGETREQAEGWIKDETATWRT